jgi:SnoaL-like domain
VNQEQVTLWLQRYAAAWKTYAPTEIADLFSEDAMYRYHPYDDPIKGRDAIVKLWVDDPDTPGTYEGRYEPIAIDGDIAVAIGQSTYSHPDGSVRKIYENCFVMRFDREGRCKDFTEWFMERKTP